MCMHTFVFMEIRNRCWESFFRTLFSEEGSVGMTCLIRQLVLGDPLPLVSPFQGWSYRQAARPTWYLCEFWDLNSGSHASVLRTLTAEPSPTPCLGVLRTPYFSMSHVDFDLRHLCRVFFLFLFERIFAFPLLSPARLEHLWKVLDFMNFVWLYCLAICMLCLCR